MISEQLARRILETTIAEGRCAEFTECMWSGGSATVDSTGKLVLLSGEQLSDLVGQYEETYERSGVWYCRTHCGTVNEDEPHGDEDECPWLDSSDNADYACDWTELLYEVKP